MTDRRGARVLRRGHGPAFLPSDDAARPRNGVAHRGGHNHRCASRGKLRSSIAVLLSYDVGLRSGVSHNASEDSHHHTGGGDARAEKNSPVHFRTISVGDWCQFDCMQRCCLDTRKAGCPGAVTPYNIAWPTVESRAPLSGTLGIGTVELLAIRLKSTWTVVERLIVNSPRRRNELGVQRSALIRLLKFS